MGGSLPRLSGPDAKRNEAGDKKASIKERGYSNGELPYSKPSATFPSLSPAVIPFISLPIRMQSVTADTGITSFAPLCRAVAMVEVALNTSMITTMLLLTSYKCNKAGEREVYKEGLLLLIF